MKISWLKIVGIAAVLTALLFTTSCASNKKCNGKKGVKTPMGLM
tara:strand:+ start:60807 stop:60938 length:132 start_codon:yes stop_codon:yes gene_type:complete